MELFSISGEANQGMIALKLAEPTQDSDVVSKTLGKRKPDNSNADADDSKKSRAS